VKADEVGADLFSFDSRRRETGVVEHDPSVCGSLTALHLLQVSLQAVSRRESP
jgi:hypothetical protein